jgi:hypothetical protein
LKHSQTFGFFAHGAFVLEHWTNAIKGKKLPAPNLYLWICSKSRFLGNQLAGRNIGVALEPVGNDLVALVQKRLTLLWAIMFIPRLLI